MIVWLASYPRSGNTFFRVILNSAFGLKTYSLYNDKADIGADKRTADVVGHELLTDEFDVEEARASEQLYLIKTHDAPVNDQDKTIYLVRDGRESALSFMKYKQRYYNSQDTLLDVIYGNVTFGGWGEHLEKWNPKTRQNTLLVKFEDLVDKPATYVEKISDFIGVKPQKKDIPTFEQLQEINPKFFRQGKNDSWKEAYTIDEHLAFWMKNHRQMSAFGYEKEKPAVFESDRLTQLLSVLTNQHAYQFNFLKDLSDKSFKQAQENTSHNKKFIADRAKQLQESQLIIADRDKQLQESQSIIADRDKQLQESQSIIADRDKQLQESQAIIADRDKQLQESQAIIADRDKQLQEIQAIIAELSDEYSRLAHSKRVRFVNKVISPLDKLRSMTRRSGTL